MWPDQQPTKELLAQAKGGDDSAVNQLMDRHRNSLRQLIRLRLDAKIQRRVDVSDVLQDVLVEANRRLNKFIENPVMPFHLWLRQIAKDRIIDAHRRHRVSAKRSVDREQGMAIPRGQDHSSIQLASMLGDERLTPAAAALQKEMAAKVEAAIARLGDKDCEIITMRHYEHLSNQEIGTILGLTEPAASMRYLRAIQRLKALMQAEESSEDTVD